MTDATTHDPKLTVFFDGACPLCVREISMLRQLDGGRRIAFEDVSPPDAEPSCPIGRERLMARFHARLPDERVVDGARAFTESWSRIPWLVWVRPIGQFPPARWLLDKLYGAFLKVRPRLQRWMRRRVDKQACQG